MKQNANLVCINPKCKKEFPIKSFEIRCDKCDFLLDVNYEFTPNPKLKDVFLNSVLNGSFHNLDI